MALGKSWNRRLAVAGTLAAGGALAVALRRPGRVHHGIADGRTLNYGNAAEPQTLDPSLATGIQDAQILLDLMEGLMALDAQARPIPGMAAHWTSSADGLIWTFRLRNASWSDGAPVTAEDFVFAWRRILDPHTAAGYSYFLYIIKNAAAITAGKLPGTALGARALDAKTLEVRVEHPAPYLLEMLAHQAMSPLPRHVVTAKGKAWARPENYVGNGAFSLKQWIPNDHVLLAKNPRYHDAANVALERVFYFPTDDYGAALQRFRAGELDVQAKLPAQQIDWIKANIPQTYHPAPQLTTEFIAANIGREPWNDVRLRHAINLAVNRNVIAGRIWRSGEVPAYSLVPPGIANYPGGNHFAFEALPFATRIAQARALMQQAGYGENRRLKTTYTLRSTAPGTYRAGAAAIQQMLAQIYIDIAILPLDMQVWIAQTHSHNFDLTQGGWGADFDDPYTFLDLFQTGGGNNWAAYSNPAYDALLASAQNDLDLAVRGRKLAAAERLLMKDHAFIPLFFWSNPELVWPYVHGHPPNVLGMHPSRWVRIDEQARRKQFA